MYCLPKCSCIILLIGTCPCPPSPSNGYTTSCSSTDSVSSYVYYHCNSGYLLTSGDSSRKCLLGGNWTGIAPVCRQGTLMKSIILLYIILLLLTFPFSIPYYSTCCAWKYFFPMKLELKSMFSNVYNLRILYIHSSENLDVPRFLSYLCVLLHCHNV